MNCKKLYLEWLGYNEYEIEEVETEIKNGEKPLEFESYKYYTWESGYNKAQEEATHNYNAIIADYDKRIAELEKENAELKKLLEMSDKVYNDNLDYSYHIEGLLTKAKDIIKELVKGIRITFEHRGFITDVDAFVSKAEQFLNGEVEK